MYHFVSGPCTWWLNHYMPGLPIRYILVYIVFGCEWHQAAFSNECSSQQFISSTGQVPGEGVRGKGCLNVSLGQILQLRWRGRAFEAESEEQKQRRVSAENRHWPRWLPQSVLSGTRSRRKIEGCRKNPRHLANHVLSTTGCCYISP